MDKDSAGAVAASSIPGAGTSAIVPSDRAALWEHLTDGFLGAPGVQPGKALGSPALTVEGKIFVASLPDGMMAKLPATRIDELVASGVGSRMLNAGRPMREWIVLPSTPAAVVRWPEIATEALQFVGEQHRAASAPRWGEGEIRSRRGAPRPRGTSAE
ncbi:hypothetical protein GIS00_07640 [Nakamurella sp. YIM 132087]|uniref:MmcQ/YjbR family DNA-binding protein n=1 Tax=Nakamurella alba TaxID=2665158 RepID=A0A7K1FI69_9ACTN|nr:hypothetical protein [Nakamurella alba]MTD13812.1 hypothetical protein [Nakamurella alba]